MRYCICKTLVNFFPHIIFTVVMVDSVDTGIALQDIVFDKKNEERKSWEFFGRKTARSQVVFLFQVLMIMIIVGVSIFNLTVAKTCEETTVWVAILSSSVGYILPAPKI